jgi:hypothetical protein
MLRCGAFLFVKISSRRTASCAAEVTVKLHFLSERLEEFESF